MTSYIESSDSHIFHTDFYTSSQSGSQSVPTNVGTDLLHRMPGSPNFKRSATQNESSLPQCFTHTRLSENEKQPLFYKSRKFGYKSAIGELNVLEIQPVYI